MSEHPTKAPNEPSATDADSASAVFGPRISGGDGPSRHWNKSAARIALTYLIISIAWILGSDRAVRYIAKNIGEIHFIEVSKGLAFITATAVLIYWLVLRALRKKERVSTDLRRIQERYDLVMQGTNEAIWDWDVVADKSYWSPKMLELIGFTRDEVGDSQTKWSTRLHPDDRDRVLKVLKEHVEHNAPYDVEYRLQTKGGQYRWFRSRGRAERDTQGKALRMAGSLADIHDRVQAAHMRDSQNQILEMVARGAPTMSVLEAIIRSVEVQHPDVMASVILLDRDGQTMRSAVAISLPNEFTKSIDGAKIGPAVGSCGTAMALGKRVIVTDINTDPLWAPYREFTLKFGLRACWSEPIHLPDGSIAGSFAMYSRESREPTQHELLMTAGAAHLAGIALHKDRAEVALRESQQRIELLISQSPVGIIILDPHTRIVDWNPAAERMFGYTAEEIIGKPFWVIVPPSVRDAVNGVWSQLISRTGGSRSSNANITKDGRLIDCEWYNAPLTDSRGQLVGVACIVEDVSDRLAIERRQQFMLAELDHRVKNNLATIASLAEQTGRSSETYPEFQQAFMGRLRAMARMHGALASAKWEGAPLSGIITHTLSTFSAGKGRYLAAGPTVMLSARQAQAVTLAIHELSTNAAKYGALSTPTGSVNVRWDVVPESAEQRAKLIIVWTESGGPVVHPPKRRGFGTDLIEGMITHELGGKATVEYPETGIRCTIEIPLDSLIPANGSPSHV